MWLKNWIERNKTWRALHLYRVPHDKVSVLRHLITEALADMGINVLVLEIGYGFDFQSHPELADPTGLTATDAHLLAELCHQHDIRLIPLFNCLGHQSWAGETFALLRKYPQFDETPHISPTNEGIYCREWCPLHPDVNRIVFDLMDEIVEAFDADAFHVGMDEVFLIGDGKCPRCKGKDVAELFAKAVKDHHNHLVKKRDLEMLMWGDRLLNAKATGYGDWEASSTGSHRAVDLIPKDIILCDWHYEIRDDYPSVRFFQQKGFRVLPATWNKPEAALALLRCAQKDATDRVLGMLFTGWGEGPAGEKLLPVLLGRRDLPEGSESAAGVAAAMKLCLKELATT